MDGKKAFVIAVVCCAQNLAGAGGDTGAGGAESEAVSSERIREHVGFLARDELGGRDSGEPGLEVAAEYIANRFREFGLQPAGDEGTYFQHFTVAHGAKFGHILGAVVLDSRGAPRKLRPMTEVVPFGHGEPGRVEAPLVFAGYGISTTEEDAKEGLSYDDYAGVDVRGKVVVVLRFTPQNEQNHEPFGERTRHHAALITKLRNARDHGAAGAVILTPPPRGGGAAEPARIRDPADDLRGLAHRASPRQPTLPALLARTEVVVELLAQAGKDLQATIDGIDAELSPNSFELPHLRLRFDTTPGYRLLRNVVGKLPGAAAELSAETIVVGGHYDHIGRFGDQVSSQNLGQIHNGADDNASGVAGVLELARVLAQGAEPPGRSVLFLCFSGEEIGLLGSRAWLEAPRRFRPRGPATRWREKPEDVGTGGGGVFPAGAILQTTGEKFFQKPSAPGDTCTLWVEVTSTNPGGRPWVCAQHLEQISGPDPQQDLIAMINLDMIGRAKPGDAVSVIGVNTSPVFPELIEAASKASGMPVNQQQKGILGGGSDHVHFLRKDIPVLFFFTGIHGEYNTPEDDTPTLNYEGERLILETVRSVVGALASAKERPPFDPKAVEHMARGHGKPRLGVQLDTEFEGVGVRVVETLPDGPAAKAGVKSGDIIVALAETKVLKIKDLLEILKDLPSGEELPLKLARSGKEEVVNVLFPARRSGFRVTFGSVPDYGFSGIGVRFASIRDGSPAAAAGVKDGDVLVRWGGKDVEDVEQWTRLLGKHKPGDLVQIGILRDTKTLDMEVKLKAR
jgi:Zn-dependent M28 family amino/carboxypeptidase